MILIQIINAYHGYVFNNFGIHPRNLNSLWTIPIAPFLHGSYAHLANNLIGFIIFSLLYILHSARRYVFSCVFIILVTGFLVWVFGRASVHVGASGLVFGLWSLCIATAWYERKPLKILIAIFVVFFYGGMIFGVLPADPNISFESHFFGVVAGILCAAIQSRKKKG